VRNHFQISFIGSFSHDTTDLDDHRCAICNKTVAKISLNHMISVHVDFLNFGKWQKTCSYLEWITKESLALLVTDIVHSYVCLLKFIFYHQLFILLLY